jgi:serine protease Do
MFQQSRGHLAGAFRVAAGAAAAGLIGWQASAAAPPGGYADLVEEVAPAVVFIETTAVAEEPRQMERRGMPGLPPGSPLEEFFERFGIPMPEGLEPGPGRGPGRDMPQRPRMGVGSGFLIDPEGLIVTNNHVVADATELNVRLDDGRSYLAEVVGTDPQTDLALIRIDANGSLPYVQFGDSDVVRPGDNVIAVGNPFGLGGSVTAGIVSAIDRDIQAGPYDAFIQIDAPINQGNSGGPLFNETGEVIGVNTAIFSPTGVNVGIGFAVPANVARDVIAQLAADGSVERGLLGVQLQQMTDEIAEALGLEESRGALVAAVTPDSPAADAGVEAGDVILRYRDREIAQLRDLPRLVAATRPGQEVEIEIHRDGETRTLTVEIAQLPTEDIATAEPPAGPPAEPEEMEAPGLGIAVAPLDEATRALANVAEGIEGVLVVGVDPRGPAAGQLRPGDVIVAVSNREIASTDALAEALEDDDDRAVLLRVWRDGTERFVGLRPAATG